VKVFTQTGASGPKIGQKTRKGRCGDRRQRDKKTPSFNIDSSTARKVRVKKKKKGGRGEKRLRPGGTTTPKEAEEKKGGAYRDGGGKG